jgi:glycosidase
VVARFGAVTTSTSARSRTADGDGVGDLRRLLSRLDHLAWLGVDALWLSPTAARRTTDCGYDDLLVRRGRPELARTPTSRS